MVALPRVDWVEAGLAALRGAGFDVIAVEPLAKSLGATKGSFYWHFADRAELVAAVLELWEQRETTDVIARFSAIVDPRERLQALGSGAYAHAATRTTLATLLAHGDDPRVAEVLRPVTRTRRSSGISTPSATSTIPSFEVAWRTRSTWAWRFFEPRTLVATPRGGPRVLPRPRARPHVARQGHARLSAAGHHDAARGSAQKTRASPPTRRRGSRRRAVRNLGESLGSHLGGHGGSRSDGSLLSDHAG